MGSEKGSENMIDEAIRRVLLADPNMTIDGGKLKALLQDRYEAGVRDMFSLVKEGRKIVHTVQSGHL